MFFPIEEGIDEKRNVFNKLKKKFQLLLFELLKLHNAMFHPTTVNKCIFHPTKLGDYWYFTFLYDLSATEQLFNNKDFIDDAYAAGERYLF